MKILIFAGGNGTRLWPVSRIKTPKQFQNLVAEKSLFQLTVERMLKRYKFEDIYIVVPQIYVNNVKEIYPDIHDDHIIIEPFKWDTLACIGYASFVINKKFPKENLFLVWSDHIIKDEEKFLDIIDAGDKYASKHKKVIKIGAKATYPEVNWGYIKFGDQVSEINNVKIYDYEHHYEKPEYAVAKKFVEAFEYLWNMGYMIWPAGKLTHAYKEYSPASYEILETITDPKFAGDTVEEYKKITKNSIDYEILEKADKSEFVVIPADVGWNDVGDWSSLKTQLEDEKIDNIVIGNPKEVDSINTTDSIVFSDNPKKRIFILGLEDVAVIDTKDALLVCSKSASRDVKKIVEELSKDDPDLC